MSNQQSGNFAIPSPSMYSLTKESSPSYEPSKYRFASNANERHKIVLHRIPNLEAGRVLDCPIERTENPRIDGNDAGKSFESISPQSLPD
jgi:hypothetical protein